MRKSAVSAVLCLSLLTGCGRMEPVVDSSDGAETTVAVENKTEKPTDENIGQQSATAAPVVGGKTTSAESTAKTTTTTTAVVVHGGGTTLTVAKRTTDAVNTTTKRSSATTAQTTTTTAAVTTTTVAPVHKTFTKDGLECRVTSEGIDVSFDDIRQTIEIDTEELIEALSDVRTEMKAQIIIEDVDLDGHDDLFIPQQIGTLNTFGVYYHYDAEEKKFVQWEELAEVDTRAEVNETYNAFTTEVWLSDDEYEVKVFAWENGLPVIKTMKKQYRSPEDKEDLLIDYFEYPYGEKLLVKRERVLFDADGREVGAEEVELD